MKSNNCNKKITLSTRSRLEIMTHLQIDINIDQHNLSRSIPGVYTPT